MTRLLLAAPAIFMICLAAGVLLGTSGLKLWDGFTPGPRFFPAWLAGASVVLSGLLLLTQKLGTDGAKLDLPEPGGVGRVLAILAGLIVMALILQTTGMVPALALFMLFLLVAVLRAPLVPSILTTAIVTVGIELLFVRWLGVPLPTPSFL
jgi:hypothetical protein